MRGLAIAAALVTGAAVGWAAPAFAAPMTFDVTSATCTGPGSFAQAVVDANANPGRDTISFSAGLTVDFSSCPLPIDPGPTGQTQAEYDSFFFAARLTESVDIVGNGSTIDGRQSWVNASGSTNVRTECPRSAGSSTTLVRESPGLLQVGLPGADNSAIEATVTGLTLRSVSAAVRVMDQAALEITDSTFLLIEDVHSNDCTTAPLQVDSGGALSLTDTAVAFTWTAGIDAVEAGGAISGGDDASLTLRRTTLEQNASAAAISWDGDVIVESSRALQSGGITHSGGGAQIVNSAWIGRNSPGPDDQIRLLDGSTSEITASTLTWPSLRCTSALTPTCVPDGMGIFTAGTATGSFSTSAVGGFVGAGPSGPMLFGTAAFTSDATTWIQPTAAQDAAAINSILAGALNAPPGLPGDDDSGSSPASITPLLGTPGTPGVLIDAVDPATCPGPNGLLSPVDATCLTSDVLGNPRVDGNGRRNIGAVQLTLAPHLQVVGTGDGSVEVSWNRPLDPPSGSITGYAVLHRPAGGSGAFMRVDVSGPDTTFAVITGLVNGVEQEFVVVAVNATGDGPTSNTVTATPLGPIGAVTPAATPGDGSVSLTWTPPDSGGRTIAGYDLLVRPLGSSVWASGGQVTTTTATVDGLVNGTAYEFGVIARSTDGAAGPISTTQATPAGPTTPPAPTTTLPSSGILPETGDSSIGPVAAAGLGLLLAGAALVVVTRRRATAT